MQNSSKQKENQIDLPDLEMIYVEGDTFLMGSDDEDAIDWEQPVHKVTVPSFYIGKYPVTQALWKAVMGADNNPSFFQGDNRPVEGVLWNETQDFIKKLNELTNKIYRLLTEAEWEYAARGGQKSQGFKYAGSNKLKDVGWYDKNSYGETKPVGLKYPNELGLYDMNGNVWELVEDQYHSSYKGAPVNGSAWVDAGEGFGRVVRGGSWSYGERICRVSIRNSIAPTNRVNYLGFRLGLSLQFTL